MTAPDWLTDLIAGDHEYRMPINPEGDTVKSVLYIGQFGAAYLAEMVWAEIERRGEKVALGPGGRGMVRTVVDAIAKGYA